MTDLTHTDRATPLNLRESLIAQYGPAVGDSMFHIQLDARRKATKYARGLQARLDDINAQIRARVRETDQALIPYTRQMDASYQVWMRACEARDAKILRDQSSLVDLRNAAAALMSELHQPDAHFVNRVRNWSRPAGYVEDVAAPPMRMDPR